MLNSDSDFEYGDDGVDSNSSSSDGILIGKPALGIDPDEMRGYDGRSSPKNGSQYLMKAMAEKRVVPKVAYADPSKLPVVVVTRSSIKNSELINPNFLERFLQMCSAYEEEQGKMGNVNMKLLPSSKWRAEVISSFSETRTNIDRWRYRIEAAEIFPTAVKMPQNNDNTHWLKYCFGQTFVQLASTHKSKTGEEKLADFFLNLYDQTLSAKPEDSGPGIEKGFVGGKSSGDDDINFDLQCPHEDKTGADEDDNHNNNKAVTTIQNEVETTSETTESDTALVASDTLVNAEEKTPHILGHRPLMNLILQLDQTQLENLVKYNFLWLKSFGFVNECQGEWLYAILACIGKPVEPTIMSDFRSIARILISIRNSISDWSSDFEGVQKKDDISSDESTENKDAKIFDFINSLNLFIYIIADYFQQKDLILHL